MTTTSKTADRREERIQRRAGLRAAAAAKVQAAREWRRARAEAAQVRIAARAKELRDQPRGVDRVPDRLRGLSVTEAPHEFGKRPNADGDLVPISSELGTSVIDGRRVVGPYAQRRARGARGHRRKPRRRDMPGAVQRRIERGASS